jgi:hypothetical protein
MLTVGLALMNGSRMDVDVGDHAQTAPPADIPQLAEVAAIEADDAGVERMRVKVVVEDKVDDARYVVPLVAQEERTAFPGGAATALAKASDETAP